MFNIDTFQEPPKPASPRFVDRTGRIYGQLTVVAFGGMSRDGRSTWVCKCSCGRHSRPTGTNLQKGISRSCGCHKREVQQSLGQRVTTHGDTINKTKSPEYRAYTNAKARCNNPRNIRYSLYGARGIEFRFASFPEFLDAVGRKPGTNYSLDRIDNDGHYEVGNIRWLNNTEQVRNRRVTKTYTHNGQTFPLAEWAEITGTKYHRLWERLYKYRWCFDCAISSHRCVHKSQRRRSNSSAS